MKESSRGRRILGNALLLIVSLIVALGAAELFLQIQEPWLHLTGTRAEWALGRYSGHPIWHHWLRPNSVTGIPSINAALNPAPIVTQTNALGCKDAREFHGAAAEGTYRILVLGDSFTEGYYPEEGFAGVLERRLSAADPGQRYEVINCGTSSYSPLLHFLRYTHHLKVLEPDEVIVNIDLTDVFDDNVRYAGTTVLDADGTPRSAGPGRFSRQRIADELRFRFYLARLITGMPGRKVTTYEYDDIFAHHSGRIPPGSEVWEQHVGYTIGMLERLVDAVSASGARAMLTMYPYREQVDSIVGRPKWNRAFEMRVAAFAREKGVPFHSAFDDLVPLHAQGMPIYWADDFHFTYFGQRAWSEAFATHYIDGAE